MPWTEPARPWCARRGGQRDRQTLCGSLPNLRRGSWAQRGGQRGRGLRPPDRQRGGQASPGEVGDPASSLEPDSEQGGHVLSSPPACTDGVCPGPQPSCLPGRVQPGRQSSDLVSTLFSSLLSLFQFLSRPLCLCPLSLSQLPVLRCLASVSAPVGSMTGPAQAWLGHVHRLRWRGAQDC